MKAAASIITTVNDFIDLPGYRVRQSSRARNVNLTFNPVDGLTVVIPRGFDTSLIPGLLLEQGPWISRQLAKYQFQGSRCREFSIPQSIVLTATDARWKLVTDLKKGRTVQIRNKGSNLLMLTGAIDNEEAVQSALHRWLKRAAHQFLSGRLSTIAARHELKFERVTIRLQRSRWGSCSARGTISLNARLMFLEPDLVDHVLLHELCHTRHLNHSSAFWETVEDFEPDYRLRRKRLAAGWSSIPDWALSRPAATIQD